MKTQVCKSIPVPMNLEEVLMKLSGPLFERVNQRKFQSEEETKEWLRSIFQGILFCGDLSTAVLRYQQSKLCESITGPLGNRTYIDSQKRGSYARRLPSKSPESTPKRKIQQDRMKLANQSWKTLPDGQKNLWEVVSKPFNKGGVHLFKGIYVSLLVDHQPIPDPFLPTPELMDYYTHR
jgi:hypothetical protein